MDCVEMLFDQRLVLSSAPVVSLTCAFCNSIQHNALLVIVDFLKWR
jgi:hypothetical protein